MKRLPASRTGLRGLLSIRSPTRCSTPFTQSRSTLTCPDANEDRDQRCPPCA